MACSTTTSMYLNVSTDICADASASRSGNTITVSGTFTVSQSSAWNYNAIYAYVNGRTSWTRVKPYYQGGGTWTANFSFSFEDSGAGSPSYEAIFQVWNNAESGGVGGTASVWFSVSYPSGVTAPTGLGINSISVTDTSVSANVYVSGWGGAGDANSRYRNLSVMRTNYKPDNQRRYQRVYGNATSGIITVTSNTQYGTGTIDPNTRYWLWWYATNGTYGTGAPETSTTEVVTKAAAPTVSLSSAGTSNAIFSYSTSADGGFYDKTLQYSLDGGVNWTTVSTITGGTASTGDFFVANLLSGAEYSLQTRVITTAGTTTGPTVTFSTRVLSQTKSKTYGPVSGEARQIGLLYGSNNGQSITVNKLYGSMGGRARLIAQSFGHIDYSQ